MAWEYRSWLQQITCPNVGAIASGFLRHRTKGKNKLFRYIGENEQTWLSTPPWQLQTPIKMFIFRVCVLLEIESRPLYMLGKSLTIELYAPKICTMGNSYILLVPFRIKCTHFMIMLLVLRTDEQTFNSH